MSPERPGSYLHGHLNPFFYEIECEILFTQEPAVRGSYIQSALPSHINLITLFSLFFFCL